MQKFGIRGAIALIALVLTPCSSARASTLFDHDGVLDVTLSGPLSRTIRSRSDREEFPFVLTVDGMDVNVNARLRGHSRVRLCRFPPLRLRFDQDAAGAALLAGLGRVKMVTHCKTGDTRAEDSMLSEYAAYRLFNRISDKSYRVRLLRVTYIDTDGKLKGLDDRAYFAFLIEPDELLAARLGSRIIKPAGVPYPKLDPRQTALMSLFQYAIGNSDWSFVTARSEETCCHNVDLVESEGRWQPIPYDFDQAGFVAAVYKGSYRTNQTARRRYGGYCRSSMESIAAALDEITSLEASLQELVRSVPFRDPDTVERRAGYLNEFFAAARDRQTLLEELESTCIGRH